MVLRTAYLADYFESPWRSTAEEVASALDITGSTLLYHLRAGQRKFWMRISRSNHRHPKSSESRVVEVDVSLGAAVRNDPLCDGRLSQLLAVDCVELIEDVLVS